MSVGEAGFHDDVSPETCLRIQDQAILDWLSKIKCRGQLAKVVTGWGSRQFRDTTQLHSKKPARQAIPLPMMTVTNTLWKPDSNRWTKSPVRMMGIGPTSRANTRYVADAAFFDENAYGPDGIPVHPDGTTTSFTGYVVTRLPIRRGTITISFVIGGNTFTAADDGHGQLLNTSHRIVSSYVKYDAGNVNVTFTVPPDDHSAVVVRYATEDSDSRDQVVHAPFPLPVTITYQVDIWTKTKQDMRALLTGVLERFEVHPDLTWITAEFPIYGTKQLYIEITNAADASELETAEEERELRHAVTLDLHGWIFREPYTVKAIRNAHLALVDAQASDLDEEAFTDWYSASEHYHLNADGSRITSVDESPIYAPPNRVLEILTWDDGTLVVGP